MATAIIHHCAMRKLRICGMTLWAPGGPLIEIARTKTKPDAESALEQWRGTHPDVAALLRPADILLDGMRGSSSLWYRVRINLQHVPEAQRPEQEELLVAYDPWAGKAWPGNAPSGKN